MQYGLNFLELIKLLTYYNMNAVKTFALKARSALLEIVYLKIIYLKSFNRAILIVVKRALWLEGFYKKKKYN